MSLDLRINKRIIISLDLTVGYSQLDLYLIPTVKISHYMNEKIGEYCFLGWTKIHLLCLFFDLCINIKNENKETKI